MRKQITLIGLCLLFGTIAATATELAMTTDTMRFLNPGDTIYVEINDYDEKIYTYTLKEGETLWSLAQYFGLRPEELDRFNRHYAGRVFQPGDKIRIPIPNKAIVRFAGIYPATGDFLPVCYVVKRGDTVFGIAQRQYRMPVDTLIRRNGLEGKPLQPGQILHTGWMSAAGIPDSLQNHAAYVSYDRDSRAHEEFEKGQRRYNERGAAVCMSKEKGGKNIVVVLHNKAKIGKIIEIRNPSANKIVYAKVVGRIPPGAYAPGTIAVLSPLTARMLGAKSEKLFVEIKYK